MAQIVILKRAHFFSIDNDLIDVHARHIGAIGIAIYNVLARYANRKTGECWPAIGRIASILQLARSTVKVYLRKLEEVGLIAITERQDEAGDPTSNLYTLLDPSPAAVAKRLADRKAAAACERGRPPADPHPSEEVGCLPTHPRPPADLPGRPPADPEPNLSLEPEELNQAGAARAAEETPATPPRPPCPHPLEERSHFGAVAVCQHCWTLLATQAEPVPGAPEPGEEGQAHSATDAA
jgi:hypothetical protein